MPAPNPLAFSTVACPTWEIDRVIDAALEYGYQGVELRTFGAGANRLASDPADHDPEMIRAKFEASGLQVSMLATSVALHHKSGRDGRAAIESGKSFIDLAARLGCERIRAFGYQIYPGEPWAKGIQRVADRFKELADYAEDFGVETLIENAGSFARARELWQLADLTDHPLVGVCWNIANAAAAGERPGLSVTTLNSRIRYAKIKDTVVGEGTGFVLPGEGTVEVLRFVELLRGIGFEGWLCFEWDKLWLPSLEEAEETLPKAQATLSEWMREKFDKKGKPLSRYEAPALEVKAE